MPCVGSSSSKSLGSDARREVCYFQPTLVPVREIASKLVAAMRKSEALKHSLRLLHRATRAADRQEGVRWWFK